jgi:hypothetical protein
MYFLSDCFQGQFCKLPLLRVIPIGNWAIITMQLAGSQPAGRLQQPKLMQPARYLDTSAPHSNASVCDRGAAALNDPVHCWPSCIVYMYRARPCRLTPGPLVVVLKVAASQVANASGYWPPTLPDAVETIGTLF